MVFVYNKKHRKKFLRVEHLPQIAVGRSPLGFAQKIGITDQNILQFLPEKMLTRQNLINRVNRQVNDRVIFLLVMAWGGMRIDHAQMAWENTDAIAYCMQQIRYNRLTRMQAYQRFQDAIANANVHGLGPAYFTKLIFFLTCANRRDRSGYIMDQWTAKSVNLLADCVEIGGVPHYGSVVDLTRQGFVHQNNDAVTYERFCQVVDDLGEQLRITQVANPDNIPWSALAEEYLFSKGGKHPGAWRRYVKDNWRHPRAKVSGDPRRLTPMVTGLQGDIFEQWLRGGYDVLVIFGHAGFNVLSAGLQQLALPCNQQLASSWGDEWHGRPQALDPNKWLISFHDRGGNHGLDEIKVEAAFDHVWHFCHDHKLISVLTNGVNAEGTRSRQAEDERVNFLYDLASRHLNISTTFVNLSDVFVRNQP